MVNSLAQVIIACSKQPHDTSPCTHDFPTQLIRSILPISTKTQSRTQSNNRDRIPNEYRIIRIGLEMMSSLLALGLGVLPSLGCSLRSLLVFLLGASFGGFGFLLDALGLRGGLDLPG